MTSVRKLALNSLKAPSRMSFKTRGRSGRGPVRSSPPVVPAVPIALVDVDGNAGWAATSGGGIAGPAGGSGSRGAQGAGPSRLSVIGLGRSSRPQIDDPHVVVGGEAGVEAGLVEHDELGDRELTVELPQQPPRAAAVGLQRDEYDELLVASDGTQLRLPGDDVRVRVEHAGEGGLGRRRRHQARGRTAAPRTGCLVERGEQTGAQP